MNADSTADRFNSRLQGQRVSNIKFDYCVVSYFCMVVIFEFFVCKPCM